MLLALNILLFTSSALLAIPLMVFTLESLLSLFPPSPSPSPLSPRPPIAILIPAHNEETGIHQTLTHIIPQLTSQDRLLVIADNCTDSTAPLATQAGATTLIRHDPTHPGKGYALAHGLEHLRPSPPAVVLFIDADCIVTPGSIDTLARTAAATNRPAQAIYLMSQPPNPTPKDSLSALAFLFKNQVRPLGLHRLGFPCLLTGTGMAFPWSTLSQVSLASGNIVEDMQLGLDIALAGHPPKLCPHALVRGSLPDASKVALTQRRRWEHGHLQTLLTQGPRLFFAGIFKLRLDLLALAADLCVPPLSLLLGLWFFFAFLACVLPYWRVSWLPALILLSNGALMSLSLVAAWFKFGRRDVPLRALLSAPWYMLWKLPLYLSFLFRRERRWVRTHRALPGEQNQPMVHS